MAGLRSIFILIAVSYVVTGNSINYDVLAIKWLNKVTAREAEATAKAVRNITLTTPASKVQLASMTSTYLLSIDYALYSLNNLIPNILNDDSHKVLVKASQKLNGLARELQDLVPGDSEILKEKLAWSLDEIKEGVTQFEQHFKVPNKFAGNQIVKALNIILYNTYKLKCQAIYFKETNKQLKAIIDETLATFVQTINSLPESDNTVTTLRQLLEHLTIIAERAVHKQQNWIVINSNDIKNVETVKACSRTLSDIYDKLHRAVTGSQIASVLKTEVRDIHVAAAKDVDRLAEIEYAENSGGQEFIRDILFDTIAISVAYGENLKYPEPVV